MILPPDDISDFAALRAEQHSQHGLTIAYIKKRVGEGMEYANEVAQAVLSTEGGYYQLREMPEEFAGALGTGVSHRLVAEAEARELLGHVAALVEQVASGAQSVRSLSLYMLYAGGSLRSRQGMYVFERKPGEPPFAHGAWLPKILPRFFKLNLDCGDDAPLPAFGFARGVLFFLAPQGRDDGRSLLAILARTPTTQDLGAHPMPTTMN